MNTTPQTFTTGNGTPGKFYSLPDLETQGIGKVSRLPVSIRIVLESLLRNLDGKKVMEADVKPCQCPGFRDRAGSRICRGCRCLW